jgi:hypothetical protein
VILSWIAEMAVPFFVAAAVMVVAGAILFVVHLIRLVSFSRKAKGKVGVLRRIMGALLSACLVLFGLFVLTLVMFSQTYEVFTREKPVARIQCVPVEGRDYTMVLRFAPITAGKMGEASLYRLTGDQWVIGGHILRWHPWLNLLGLHTGYRITRLEGRYLEAEDQTTEARTVYDVGEWHMQPIWQWLYQHHEDIPWVKTAYGNTVYAFPDKDKVFVLAVTHSGFTVTSESVR